MPDVAKLRRMVAYLREEIPAEDISTNPVVNHPHNTARVVPVMGPLVGSGARAKSRAPAAATQ